MRIRKTKAKIGRDEPFFCANHDKREAAAKRSYENSPREPEDLCNECLAVPGSRRAKMWARFYKEQGI